MKKFLHKKWLSIPVIVILVLALTAGSVFAAYSFLTVGVKVDVEEAIVVAMWPAWDNLEPYGSVDDVEITLGGTETDPVLSITTIPGYAGAGFVAGESIVIPVNFRNAGDGELNLGALVIETAPGLVLEYIWEENVGEPTEVREGEPDLSRDFRPTSEDWNYLSNWTGTIASKGGMSGSAVIGAQVLFIKITARGDIPAPATYSLAVIFTRH